MNWKTLSIIQELLIILKDTLSQLVENMQKAYLQSEKSVKSLQQRKFLEKSMWVILQIDHKKRLSRGPAFKQEEEEEEEESFFFYRWLAISQNVVFNRALHKKNKIATVLKITKTKINNHMN